jgi:hypothetical protein
MTEQQSGASSKQNGNLAILTTLAQSTSHWVQLATVGLIALSGLGNWLATQKDGVETRTELSASREQAFRNIKELHDALDDFEKRQKAILDGLQLSARNQQQMLDNQGRILSEIRQAHQ